MQSFRKWRMIRAVCCSRGELKVYDTFVERYPGTVYRRAVQNIAPYDFCNDNQDDGGQEKQGKG